MTKGDLPRLVCKTMYTRSASPYRSFESTSGIPYLWISTHLRNGFLSNDLVYVGFQPARAFIGWKSRFG